MRKNLYNNFFFKYTLLFTIFCGLMFNLFFIYGKSILFEPDGIQQHYNFIVFFSDWVKHIFYSLFINHHFSLSLFDLSIGLGNNISGTLNFYGFGDILLVFAPLIPLERMESFYTFIGIFRLYLMGITFYLYAKHHDFSNDNILAGALVYVFSFYTICVSTTHPCFFNPPIYFPLILLGIDYIFEGRKPLLFIITCALACYSSVYFFYMISILIFIYAVVHYYFSFNKTFSLKHLIDKVSICVGCYFLSLIISIPVFLPFAKTVLGGNRVSGDSAPLFYTLMYYIKLPIAFINSSAANYTHLGYTVIGVLAVVLLFFCNRKKNTELKVFFIIGTLMILFPIAGSVLNGFGYPVNRWIWAYCLLISIIVVKEMPLIIEKMPKIKWLMVGFLFLTSLPTYYWWLKDKSQILLIFIIFGATAGIIICSIILTDKSKNSSYYAVIILVASNVFLNGYAYFSPKFFGYVDAHLASGTANKDMETSYYKIMNDNGIDPEVMYRLDVAGLGFGDHNPNLAKRFNRLGTEIYYSTNDSQTQKFFRDMKMSIPTELCYFGLNERFIIESAMGCKFVAVKNGEENLLPFGYDKLVGQNDFYSIYETEYSLPLVYTFDSFISNDTYNGMTSLEKQQLLLQCASIDAKFAKNVLLKEKNDFIFNEQELEYNIVSISEGIKILENGRIEVSNPGSYVEIEVPSYSGEYYFEFENLWYENTREKIPFDNGVISVQDSRVTKNYEITSKYSQSYSNIHDIICNHGYKTSEEDGVIKFKISFNSKGRYYFDYLKIYCQPLDNMIELAKERTKDTIDYNWDNGIMNINCHVQGDRILYLAVPFQKNCKASIDGKKTDVFCVNNFGTGVLVPRGTHSIMIKY